MNATDPKMQAIATDMNHASIPVGPVGQPTRWALFFTCVIFKYTKYPNAAKEYLRFMMEKEQYEAWQKASISFVTQPLTFYERNPVWTVGSEAHAFQIQLQAHAAERLCRNIGHRVGGCMADFVVVNMVAQAASGNMSVKEAVKEAEKRAKRYYR